MFPTLNYVGIVFQPEKKIIVKILFDDSLCLIIYIFKNPIPHSFKLLQKTTINLSCAIGRGPSFLSII